MTNDAILLPCPFCGSKELEVHINAVDCLKCGGSIINENMQQVFRKDGKTIAAWNTRAATTPPITPEVRDRCYLAARSAVTKKVDSGITFAIVDTAVDAVLAELNIRVGRE